MTAIEEFIFSSDKLKNAILDEALRENAILRERLDNIQQDLTNTLDRMRMLQSKLTAMESVNARLLAQIDDQR